VNFRPVLFPVSALSIRTLAQLGKFLTDGLRTDKLMTELLGKVPVSLVGVALEDALRAARLKARYNIPYADAFAAALTRGQHVLVTADIEHFERVPKLRLLRLPRAKKANI
jgi:predicted nucleic acid-binding protein